MSLKIWMPMNGNINNNGLSNAEIKANNLFFEEGKMGKAATFKSGSSSYISINNTPVTGTIGELSFCFWLKASSVSTNMCIYNGRAATGKAIGIFCISGKLRFDDGTQKTFSYGLKLDTWEHFCITRNSEYVSLYVNGVFVERKASAACSTTATKATIGGSSTDSLTASANWLIGQLNDYRIYDHCLSKKEIYEISKGLILHYLLSEPINDSSIEKDRSGFGNDGTRIGDISINTDSIRHNSCSYLSEGAYINCLDGAKVTDAITVNIWVHMDTWVSEPRPISCTEAGGWNIEASSGVIAFVVYGATKDAYINASSSVKWADLSSGWHMFTGSYDGNTAKLYIDGVLSASKGNGLSEKENIKYYAKNSIFIHAESATKYDTPASTLYKACKMSDARIYATALSETAVKELYAGNISMDINGMYSTSITENSGGKTRFKNKSEIESNIFSESVINNLDSKYYTESDGSVWVKIFHHNNPATNKFGSTDDFSSYVYKSSDVWFNGALCNKTSTWELLIIQKADSTDTVKKFRFIQNSNPMVATYDDVAVSNVSFVGGEYTTPKSTYGGLYKNGTKSFLTANNGNASNWYGAIGCWTDYSGGIPGYNATKITDGYIDLYLRIDNTKYDNSNVQVFKKGIVSQNFNEI